MEGTEDMFGRYSNGEKITIKPRYVARGKTFFLQPHYNICPAQMRTVIVLKDGQLQEQERRWGDFPSWTKEVKKTRTFINLKSETVLEKFGDAVRNRRCLVPADGFYEWETTMKGKLPWRFVLRSEEPFCFAGVYNEFTPPPINEDAKPPTYQTYSILTCEPNRIVKEIHHRMPVIIQPEHYDEWLDPGADDGKFMSVAQPYPAEWMEGYRVSKFVNMPKNDSPECIKLSSDAETKRRYIN